ncbi:MAG TPA: NAD(P)/FAD-dependent oxidoreductase [Capillimicrobium sp.]|jgi:cation diffusion facilitator CzcD-associated flavoprotein CzcO
MAHALPAEVEVAIIGAGFGGLGAAIRLRQAGRRRFAVLERGRDLGGTWYANTYPGAQCDVPSSLYSFSFAPKADWARAYPEGPEIHAYLRDCAERFGVRDRVHTETEVTDATWDGGDRRWVVATTRGTLRARWLVAAPGLLSEPSIPQVDGLDRFAGAIFHTAAWDHAHRFAGERVGLIGTGATAIQVGPRLAGEVASLTVFQRTPPWILPHPDRAISPLERRLRARAPLAQRAARAAVYAMRETLAAGMAYAPPLLKGQELVARAHLRRQVADPALRRALTPSYAIGCKRVLLSGDWYPMLGQPHVELVTAGVTACTERGLVTADGREHPLDSLVLATGFTPTDPPLGRRVRGAGGQTLSEAWDGSPQAHLGTTVAGFPNLFLLYGPNTNLGHSSIVFMLESQIAYLMDALRVADARGAAALEVRADAQAASNAEVQRRLARSVWNTGGCGSWYLDAHGRNATMWPGFSFEFRRRTRRFDAEHFHLDPGGSTPWPQPTTSSSAPAPPAASSPTA